MFLKGIKDKFKYKSGQKYLKQELAQAPKSLKPKKGVTSIGVIVDLDNFDNPERFYELIDSYGLRPNAVKIIGYKSYYDKNSPYATPVFSDKDLGWNGAIENSYALEFLSRDYDLLINYYYENNLLMQLMSVKTNAGMRIGFSQQDPAFNDLIFGFDMSDFSLFKKELKKYLKVLNHIS